MAKATTLYLRGLPEELVREAKATAARRGVTLGGLVAEALRQVVGQERVAPVEQGLAESMRWFEANRRRLLRRYRGQYVAIRAGRVLDHDTDFGALAARVFARVGDRPVFMPKVTEEERVVRLPSPMVVES